jgi:acyl-CoA synthetase (NDP forming)
LFEACGIATVGTVEALASACALLSGRSAAAAPAGGLVCVTTSGAGGAILADFASDRGLRLAGSEGGTWGAAAAAEIAALPTAAPIRNPIDMGSLGDWGLLAPVLKAAADDGEDGATVVYAHVAPGPGMAAQLAAALVERRQRVGAPMAVLTPGGLGDAAEAQYTAAGIPVFHDTAACFDSLQACLQAMQWRARDAGSAAVADAYPEAATAPTAEAARAIVALLDASARAAGPQGFLGERASAEILRACGLPMVHSDVVSSAAAARDSAARRGGAVVLKALAPGVAHKNAQGLVLTRIDGPEAAAQAFELLAGRVRAAGFAPSQVEFLLQALHPAELELILGVSHEPGLGHFLVFGLGGIHTEVFDRVELLALPVSPQRLRERLAASPLARLLHAVDPACSADWLAQTGAALLALQRLMQVAGDRIDSVDVNPLRVGRAGCVAVDALVVMRAAGHDGGAPQIPIAPAAPTLGP